MDQSFCCVSLCNQVSLHFSFFFFVKSFFLLYAIILYRNVFDTVDNNSLTRIGELAHRYTDEAGRQNDWFQKIYYSDVKRTEKNFDSFHQIIHSRIFIPFFPLQTQFSRYKRQQSYVVNSSMNLDVIKGVRA